MADSSVQRHKSFTIRFKWQAIGVINEVMKSRLSIYQSTDSLQIHHWHFAMWEKTMQIVDNLIEKDEVLTFSISGDIKKLNLGCPSSLTAIKSDLSCSIFELCEQGLQINT